MVNINNLFKLISIKGITQSKLAEDTSVSTGNISDWKKGKSMPSAVKLDELATYFGCSVDYLLGRTDNPELSKESYYINGDNNGIQSNKGSVSIESKRKNDIEEEFMQAFETLELSDKVDVMSFTMQKMKKEE